jgi:hypothetical protein
MSRSDSPLDQIVFRWDADNASGTTGFGPVAWSCDRERADSVFRGAAPMLRSTGEDTVPALIRLEHEDNAVLLHRAPWRDPDGRTATVCHALVGSAAHLDAQNCLGLHTWSWMADDFRPDEVRGDLPPVPVSALMQSVNDGQQELTDSLAGVEAELTGLAAEFLRGRARRFTLLDRRGGTSAFRVLWGMSEMFGGLFPKGWSFATHDTYEHAWLRFAFVREWPGAATEDTTRMRLDPRERRADRAQQVAERLVGHHLSRPVNEVHLALKEAGAHPAARDRGPGWLLDTADRALTALDGRSTTRSDTGARAPADQGGANGERYETEPLPTHGPDRSQTPEPYGRWDSCGPSDPSRRTVPPHPSDPSHRVGRSQRPDVPGGLASSAFSDPKVRTDRPQLPDQEGGVDSARPSDASRRSAGSQRQDPTAELDPSRPPGQTYDAGQSPPPMEPRLRLDRAPLTESPVEPVAGSPLRADPPGFPEPPHRPGAPRRPSEREVFGVRPEWPEPEEDSRRLPRLGRRPRRGNREQLRHALSVMSDHFAQRGSTLPAVTGAADDDLIGALSWDIPYAAESLVIGEIVERWPAWGGRTRRKLRDAVLVRELWVGAVDDPGGPGDEIRAANAASLYRWAVRPLLAGDPQALEQLTELLARLLSGSRRAGRGAVWQIAKRSPRLPEATWLALLRAAHEPHADPAPTAQRSVSVPYPPSAQAGSGPRHASASADTDDDRGIVFVLGGILILLVVVLVVVVWWV